MMSVSLCIHCWCGRFYCWWHGSQSVTLHPLVMLIHIYQRSPFDIILCLHAPSLYRHGGLQIYHVTYYALDMRIYNAVLIWDLNIYNLSNIACHYHKFCVINWSRLHIVHVRHPRQRAGKAITCPAVSLAHRATTSCTPIVHPSCQPGPSGNRQLHAHCAPQLPAWPIEQPPAARPLCTPAASLAHRATASCMPIVHPSCQPGPSCNSQLHAHSTPTQLPAWPIGQPPAARP